MRKFSYKNLFKKLIDLDMTNNELMEKANVSNTLDCDISEIVECEKVI